MNNNKTVLVISDGHEQFALTASLLRSNGYFVQFEDDITHSLTRAAGEPPHLIISELAVPNVDGLKLCRRVRNERALGSTPVLLVGDLSNRSSIVEDGLRCGATGYMQKPIDQFKLFDLCRTMVGSGEATPAFGRDENLFKSMIEDISDVVMIIADDSTILFASPSSKRIHGYEPAELLGARTLDLVHPADLKEVTEFFNWINWDSSRDLPVEYRFLQKDGSWKLMESTGRPILDPEFGSAVIVTTREKAEPAFTLASALENEILRTVIFDDASIGLAMFSPSGHLLESNQALLQMLDHAKDELHGMSLSEFVFPLEPEKDRRHLLEVYCGKRSFYRFMNGYMTPTGERVWGRLTVISIADRDNASTCLIGVFEEPAGDKLVDAPAPHRGASHNGGEVSDFPRFKIDADLICEN